MNAAHSASQSKHPSPGKDLSRSQIMGSFGASESLNFARNATFTTATKVFANDPDQSLMGYSPQKIPRPQPRIIYRGTESSDEEENEQFHANPAEDIPRNKLVDKLVRGLQSYI